MRKIKLQVQISVDGFVSTGDNDEQKWVTWAWDEIRSHVLDLFDSCDTILIGRKLAMDYIPYWQEVSTKPDDPMHEVGVRIDRAKKIVFTRTLAAQASWRNTDLAQGELADEVERLKVQPGKDIIVYGGSSFVSALIRGGHIDEFHLFVNPVAIGHGGGIFDGLASYQSLKLIHSHTFTSGIVLLQYERA